MLAKWSSASTTSEASRATSVPVRPMAMPMWASFNAGASFTPSPVTATTSRLRLSAATTRRFSTGPTRANTTSGASRAICNWASDSRRSSGLESTTGVRERTRPTCRATASAVRGWSPVTMMTRMPASRHRWMASGTSGRMGSSRPTSPERTRASSRCSRGTSPSTLREAKASTRSPSRASCSPAWRKRSRSSGVSGRGPSSVSSVVHRGSTVSSAPLV